MRKPLAFLIAAALLVIVAAAWAYVTAGFVMGGKEVVTLFRPEALWLLYGALALFAIALVFTITAAVRVWMHHPAPAERPARPEQNAPATN